MSATARGNTESDLGHHRPEKQRSGTCGGIAQFCGGIAQLVELLI